MKAFALALSLCLLGVNVAAQEVVTEPEAGAECETDPVAEERAVSDAQRSDLARAFVTVTTETVDDALERTDAYWDTVEGESQVRVSTGFEALFEAAMNPPLQWAQLCRSLTMPSGWNCLTLQDTRFRDLCSLVNIPGSGGKGRPCESVWRVFRPACERVYSGRREACERTTPDQVDNLGLAGGPHAVCERVGGTLDGAEAACGPTFDAVTCLQALVFRALRGGLAGCDAVGGEVDVATAELLRRSCRAIVTRDTAACPKNMDAFRHKVLVDVLLRVRHGGLWLVASGLSTGSAMCAVDVELGEGDGAHRELMTFSLPRGSYMHRTHSRVAVDVDPMRVAVNARTVCVPAFAWGRAAKGASGP